MKKLCFVEYDMTVTGGVEQVTTSLANAFCNEYEVYIYGIFGKGKEVPYDLDSRIYYHAELEEDCRIRKRITSVFKPFKNYIEENQIDLVFLMENHPAIIVSPVRFFTRAKYVFCDHGALMNEWEKKDITAFRFWAGLISHRIVTLTEQNRLDYINQLKVNPQKIQSIYNWISPEVLKIKKEYKEESKKIITVGRFSEEKGYDMLVEAAKQIMPKYPDWEWHLYGTGDTFGETKRKIVQYGLENQVILKGNIKDAYQVFGEYAFLVLPSYREGLPLVLLEAKATGLPMISFDILTGPKEIIVNGKDGYLIPPYDIKKMIEYMEILINNKEKRKRFSAYTQKGIEKFQKEYIYQEWKVLIESTIRSKKNDRKSKN